MATKSQIEQPGAAAAAYPWSAPVRAIVSVALALHVLAVFSAPWSAPPPASELSRSVAGWFRPYLFGAFLNHGYRFFAPNPGASHLVEYELKFDDGHSKTGRFPNLDEHWPRLLYHRHFMLAETVHQATDIPDQPQEPPRNLPPGIKQMAFDQYHRDRQIRQELIARRDLLLEAIAARLLQEHSAQSVQLWAVEHAILPPEAVIAGERIDREETYLRRDLGVFPKK